MPERFREPCFSLLIPNSEDAGRQRGSLGFRLFGDFNTNSIDRVSNNFSRPVFLSASFGLMCSTGVGSTQIRLDFRWTQYQYNQIVTDA